MFTKVIASVILGAVFVFVGFIAIAMVMAVLPGELELQGGRLAPQGTS